MPRHRRRARPARSFDPVQALPKSAEFCTSSQTVRQSRARGGGLQCRPAARERLAGRAPAASETRNYVLAITGLTADEWAHGGKLGPEAQPPPNSTAAHGAAPPRAQPVRVQARGAGEPIRRFSPWGVQLAAGFSREHALSNYAELAKRYAGVLTGRDPTLLSTLPPQPRHQQPFYQVRVGAETRARRPRACAAASAAPAAPAWCSRTAPADACTQPGSRLFARAPSGALARPGHVRWCSPGLRALPYTRGAPSPACGGGVGRGNACSDALSFFTCMPPP